MTHKYKEFWVEIWTYAASHTDAVLPSKLINMIYDVGRQMRKADCVDLYWQLCRCCYEVAFRLKKRLPDGLHNRMILGEQNDYTKDYVKRWGA